MDMLPVVKKLSNTSGIECPEDFGDTSNGVSFMVRTVEIFVPLAGLVDVEEELRRVNESLEYQRKFLDSVRRKLANGAFVAHAPESVVALERKKEADSLSKINSLEIQLNSLNNN